MKRRAEELLFCKLCNFSMTFSSHLQKHNNTEKHLRNCRIAVSDEGLSYQGQIYQDTDVDDRKVCSLLLTTGNYTLVFINGQGMISTVNDLELIHMYSLMSRKHKQHQIVIIE